MTDDKPMCKNCKHYNPSETGRNSDEEETEFGFCRRYPPVINLEMVKDVMRTEDEGLPEPTGAVYMPWWWVYPTVRFFELCGEFEKKSNQESPSVLKLDPLIV